MSYNILQNKNPAHLEAHVEYFLERRYYLVGDTTSVYNAIRDETIYIQVIAKEEGVK